MIKKILSLSILLIVISLSASAEKVFAAEIPNFSTCANPQGTIKVSYDSGTHGVPGNSNTFSGRDTVYSLSEDTLTQCLCLDNGDGIQTNWWKVSSLTQDQIEVLVSQGWIFIPSGASWGLQDAPYLAQNVNFSCNSPSNNGGGGGSSSGGGGSSSGGIGGSQVLGISTGEVLGLASTGNIVFILSVIISGFSALSLGLLLSLKKKK